MDQKPDRDESGSGSIRYQPQPSRLSLMGRRFVLALAFVALYVLFNRPEVVLLTKLGSTLWYPPTGLGFAFMLAISPWYGLLTYLAGVAAGAIFYHQPLLSWASLVGDPLEILIYVAAAAVLRGPLQLEIGLTHRRHVVRYAIVTCSAAVFACLTGAACLVADHSIPTSQFWTAALDWYSGDAIALVSVAPFFLNHVLPWLQRRFFVVPNGSRAPRTRRQRAPWGAEVAEGIAQAASIPAVLWLMFGRAFAPLQLYYLSFLPILWMALRQGIRRVVIGILILNFGIVLAVHLSAVGPNSFVRISLLMLVASFTGLIVGSAVSERYRMREELQEQTNYLHSLIENTPIGIVVLDRKGRVQLCNEAFERLFLLHHDELVGNDLDSLISLSEPTQLGRETSTQVFAGKVIHKTIRYRRKDGKLLDLEVNAVPLEREGEVEGAYALYQDISEQAEAQRKEREHAESLKRWVQTLQLRTMEMTALNEMGDLLQCCASSAEAYAVVQRAAHKLFPRAISGLLLEFKASRNLVESTSAWGTGHASDLAFAADTCWALRRGQPHWSGPVLSGINCSHLKDPNAPALCVPMMAQGEGMGILHLQFDRETFSTTARNDEHEALQQDQQRVATAMAGQIALSIASLKLQEKLRDQSIRDPLTGLFNRRFMHECLERELVRARRKGHPIAVLFLDIDHFKRFNDAFGHDAGDVVLQTMAGLFRNQFRADDVICRYGGEEFTVILPESSAADAGKRAGILIEEVRKLKVLHRERLLDTVTISVGVAAFPEQATTAEELLSLSDQCLYRSKKEGRDRVTVAPLSKGATAL